MEAEKIKQQILELTKEYYEEHFAKETGYVEGERVNYAGRVFDEKEMVNLVDASLDFWLTQGPYGKSLKKEWLSF